MSYAGDTYNRLETLVAYPHCPDDEVRESLYGVRRPITFTDIKVRSEHGKTIFVGQQLQQSALTQSVDKVFKCSWPDVLLEEELTSLDPPAYLKEKAGFMTAIPGDAVLNKAVYEWYPIETEQDLKKYNNALRRFRRALCTTFDVIHSRKPPWTAVYNSLMESVWYDNLRGADISISFRPRWSLYPTTGGKPGEWPVIIPDVVFSARVPISNPRLLKAQKYHPAHAFNQATQDSILEIPLLIVEYDKIDVDDRPANSEAHRRHLEAAITSALPVHSVLGLQAPIYGVFIDRYAAEYWAGTLTDVKGVATPAIHNIVIHAGRQVNFYDQRLHILHLQNIISNLGVSASGILDEIGKDATSLDLRRNIEIPVQETLRCAPNGRVIDTERPTLAVGDDTLKHIFSLNLKAVTLWLLNADISVAWENEKTVRGLPNEIQDWMCLIAEPEQVVPIQQDVATDALKGLPDGAQSLVVHFLSKYQHASMSSDTPLPNSLKADLSFDIQASLNICLHASALATKMSTNVLHPHTASSHWSVIYDSLFLRAKQHYQERFIIFESYPQWNLHRNFRSVRSKTGRPLLDEIRPSCALSYRLIQDQVILRKCKADIDHLKPEFTVKCLVSYMTGWNIVEIPVMVAEYVLVPDDADEKAKHIAHLAMTMRSALALWEIHCLKGPVIGFLMERNIVETKLGWIDDDGKCIIRDAPEYRFDLMAPNETFRLFNFLKAYCQEPSRAQLERKVEEHAAQAIARLCEPTYQMWRDLPDDEYGQEEEEERHPSDCWINRWVLDQDTGEIDIE